MRIFRILLMLWMAFPLYAGPPFITNDPVPPTFKTWELYLFSNLNNTNIQVEEPYFNMAAFELDWGVLPDVELSLIVPYTSATTNIHGARGLGDLELGLMYRFIDETATIPHIAFAPELDIPTGNADRYLGNGHIALQLPLWAQKSWGSWTTYGGGGWTLNRAPGMKNYLYAGWLLQKDLNDKWTLGAELYTQGAISDAGSAMTALNLGGNYNLNARCSFLFSAGHSVLGQQHTLAYLGFMWTL